MKDLGYELGIASKTGKLVLGYDNVLKLLQTGNPKLVILSDSTPDENRESILYYSKLGEVKCFTTKKTSIELGSDCGKPFPVSTLAVLDAGDSDILKLK